LKIFKDKYLKEPEFIFLLIYNLLTLYSYHVGNLQPTYVLWSYYLQSLYIGAQFWVLNIIQQLRSKERHWFFIFFFPIHYGGFHLGYLIFLSIMSSEADYVHIIPFLKINVAVLMVQFIVFLSQELSNRTPNHSAGFFFAPYIRIIPMHFIILLGLNATALWIPAFYIFILLKFLMDIVSYSFFHKKEIPVK